MTNDEKIIEFLRTHKAYEQTRLVLHHLFFMGEITQKTATEDYGITRLAATIWKLRHVYGIAILDETIEVPNRYGKTSKVSRYYLPC
jgi:hypothetical protein